MRKSAMRKRDNKKNINSFGDTVKKQNAETLRRAESAVIKR